MLARAEKFVDSTVQLSNAPLLVSIAAGNKEYPFRCARLRGATRAPMYGSPG